MFNKVKYSISVKKYLLSFAICTASLFATAQNDTAKAKASMNEATVYFGYGAELNHKASLSVSPATKFIVIDKLSTQLDVNSLQISCPESVSLLSQQFSVYYPTVKQPVVIANPLVQKMTDSIKKLNKEIQAIQHKIEIEDAVLTKTDKLIESTIATSINKTALTAEVLKLIEFNNAKIEKNRSNINAFQNVIEDIQERVDAINARIAAINAQPKNVVENKEKPYGRIIMQVVCRQSTNADIALSYYTSNAGWQPIYDMRVNSKTNNIKLVYKASLIQNTGIDWQNTKLTLSTGTPNFTTTAPLLSSWYLQYYVPQLYNTLNEVVVTNGYGMNRVQSFTDKDFKKGENDSEGAKRKSVSMSVATVNASTLDEYTTLKQGLLNTSFEIDLPYDIESNGLAHSINIKEEQIASTLKNYAVPKLDGEAYLLAEITNWQNLDLIPGNANIIMDDTYIGKSFLDPNTTADTLNISLGKDRRVSVKRTLVKDATTSKTTASNTKQIFTYDLVVKNNKIKDVIIILKDQFPLSNINEIEVELLDADGASINTEIGVLTWKLTLKPGESIKKRFRYSVKYPRDKKLVNIK
jgi:uncharacterized protein (TIGR02231 family)